MSTFLDYATVNIKAGKGGDGMVAFRREKYVPDGGPAGGDGGKGGNIIFVVDEGLHTLMDFKYNRHFKAKNGENGMSKSKYGAAAPDLYIKVPPGTIVRNATTDQVIADMVEYGQEIIIAKGGRGGRGNIRFATHKNPAPSISENGEPGEELDIKLELKVLADVALVGFPSVGKSTLLSVISNAKPKIADYQFTTLSPNLGVVKIGFQKEFVVADMPGLIEGASEGVGLGINFLKHIERTKVLVHVLDMASVHGRDVFEDFIQIIHELINYNSRLMLRPMIIVANKMDQEKAEENIEAFKHKLKEFCIDHPDYNIFSEVFEISAWQTKGLESFLNKTYQILNETEFIPLVEEENIDHVEFTLNEDESEFYIRRLDTHYFEIYGDKIEKLFAMTNMAHDESIARFARQLRGMGIDEALREKGAQAGDIIELSGYQFEFMD